MVAQLPGFSPVYAQRGSDGHHCPGPPKRTAGYGDPAPCRYLDHGCVAAVPCPDLHPLGHDLPYGCVAVAPPHGYGAHGVAHGSLHGYGVTGRDNHGAFSDHHGPPSHIHRHTCGVYGCHDGSVCGTDGLCWSGLGSIFLCHGSDFFAPGSVHGSDISVHGSDASVHCSDISVHGSGLSAHGLRGLCLDPLHGCAWLSGSHNGSDGPPRLENGPGKTGFSPYSVLSLRNWTTPWTAPWNPFLLCSLFGEPPGESLLSYPGKTAVKPPTVR